MSELNRDERTKEIKKERKRTWVVEVTRVDAEGESIDVVVTKVGVITRGIAQSLFEHEEEGGDVIVVEPAVEVREKPQTHTV